MKTLTIILIIFIIILVIVAVSLFPNSWDLKSCDDECQHRGYETGECIWPMETEEGDINIGICFIPQSKHCGNKGQCNCYCKDKLAACTEEAKICPNGTAVGRTGPDCEFEVCPVSKVCETDEDCVVFGGDGDCNCGCYNKEALPQESGGECFCVAPILCKCVEGMCVGVF